MTAALILAAGRSQRFGYGAKLLAPVAGMPLIALTVRRALRICRGPIVVVTGPRSRSILRALRLHVGDSSRLRVVNNRRFAAGMAGSLRVGLAAVPRHACRVLLCLGDMPSALSSRTAARLRRIHGSHPSQQSVWIARPSHDERPGHPVLIARALFPAIVEARGDQGAQSVIAGLPPARRASVSGNQASVAGADTPALLRRIAHLERRHATTFRK